MRSAVTLRAAAWKASPTVESYGSPKWRSDACRIVIVALAMRRSLGARSAALAARLGLLLLGSARRRRRTQPREAPRAHADQSQADHLRDRHRAQEAVVLRAEDL